MPVALTPAGLRLMGGLALLLVLAGLWARGEHYRGQRDVLRDWKAEVIQAARDAAHHPKLGEKHVARQVRLLGAAVDQVRAAMDKARADQLARVREQERRDEKNRRTHDAILPQRLDEARRRAADYAGRNGVRGRSDPPGFDRVDSGEAGLPEPSFGTAQPDGAGDDAELVAITRGDLDACTVNTVRLLDAQAWNAARESPDEAGDTSPGS